MNHVAEIENAADRPPVVLHQKVGGVAVAMDGLAAQAAQPGQAGAKRVRDPFDARHAAAPIRRSSRIQRVRAIAAHPTPGVGSRRDEKILAEPGRCAPGWRPYFAAGPALGLDCRQQAPRQKTHQAGAVVDPVAREAPDRFSLLRGEEPRHREGGVLLRQMVENTHQAVGAVGVVCRQPILSTNSRGAAPARPQYADESCCPAPPAGR